MGAQRIGKCGRLGGELTLVLLHAAEGTFQIQPGRDAAHVQRWALYPTSTCHTMELIGPA
jgi:hypothetical protein